MMTIKEKPLERATTQLDPRRHRRLGSNGVDIRRARRKSQSSVQTSSPAFHTASWQADRVPALYSPCDRDVSFILVGESQQKTTHPSSAMNSLPIAQSCVQISLKSEKNIPVLSAVPGSAVSGLIPRVPPLQLDDDSSSSPLTSVCSTPPETPGLRSGLCVAQKTLHRLLLYVNLIYKLNLNSFEI